MAGNINKTNIFTRPLGSSKTSQSRGGYVPSQHSTNFNPFDHNTNTINRNRSIYEQANRYAGRVNARPVTQSGFTNDINKMAEIAMYTQLGMQAGQTLLGLTKGIMNLVDSKPAGGGPAVLKSAATLQGANSAAITGMQSATTAADLRAAINNAENRIGTLNTTISEIEPQLEKLKEASDKAKVEIGKLDEEISAKNSEISKKQTEKTQAQGAVDGCKAKLDSSQKALTDADNRYSTAVTNHREQQITLTQRTAAYESTKAFYLSLPADDPGKAAAEEAMDQAEQAMDDAQKAVDRAATEEQEAYKNLGNAKTAVDAAKENYEKAEEQLLKAEENLAKTEEELKTLQQQRDKLEAEKEKQQASVDEYNKALGDLNKAKEEKSAIEAELPAQKTRLAELEKAEEAKIGTIEGQIDGYQDQIGKRNSQIEGDVDTLKEKGLQRKNEQDLDSISGLRESLSVAQQVLEASKQAAIDEAMDDGNTTYQGVPLSYNKENGTFTYNSITYNSREDLMANL